MTSYMASELSKYIGKHLHDIRLKRNLSQEDVAKRAGTERGYYAKLEQGYTLPSLKLLEKILKALDARFRDVLP
jgi:transcriptional regulator with XRE-family HTH domain